MITTSRRGSVDSARTLPATFSAGENLVAASPGLAVSAAAFRRSRSEVDRSWMSAPDEKSTSEPRSDAFSFANSARAAATRPLPVIAEPHAVAVVEQDDHFARPGANRRGVVTLDERPRERQDDERERGQPHHQQQPVVNLAPADGLIRNPPHEHQRREVDDLLLLALREVQQHGNRQPGESEEEEGRKK